MSKTKKEQPKATPPVEKPGIHLHQVSNGHESKLIMESEITDDVVVIIPNSDSDIQTTPSGEKKIKLITENRFNQWRGEIRDWLNQNIDNIITNWITNNWETVFKPKVIGIVNDFKNSLINDPDNDFPNSGYVVDATQPEGLIVKIHRLIKNVETNLTEKITKEKKERTTGDDNLKQEIYDNNPIGSLKQIYYSSVSKTNLDKNYIRCDGRVIDKTEHPELYDFLKNNDPRFYGRASSGFWNDLKVYPSLEKRKKVKREQLGYLIGNYLREKVGGTLKEGPYVFKASTIMDIIRDGMIYDTGVDDNLTRYKRSNFPKTFRLRNLLTTNFRNTSFGSLSKKKHANTTDATPFASRGSDGSVEYPYSPSFWAGGGIKDPTGDMAMNQLEKVKHVNAYNISIYIHKVDSMVSSSGTRRARLLHIAIGQSDDVSSIWTNDLELCTWVDVADETYKSDLLLYVELGNRDTNMLNEEYGILIPHEFLKESFNSDMDLINTSYQEVHKHYPLYNGVIKPHSTSISGLDGYGYSIELVNIDNTEYDWIYMRLGGLIQGRGSTISYPTASTYYPMMHPVLTYNDFDPPMSLYQMMKANGRRWDWYINFNLSSSSSGGGLVNPDARVGYINRFSMSTNGILKLVGLDESYTFEQFDTFWDELIASCPNKGWDTNPDKSLTTYPRIGGVDVESMPVCSTTNPPGFSGRNAFSGVNTGTKGCHYGFSYDIDSNELGYPIRGSRIVLKVVNMSGFYLMVDQDATNRRARGDNYGFIMHCNGSWKDLSYYLDKVDSNKNHYGANSLPNIPNDPSSLNKREEFMWSDAVNSLGKCYQSAGLVRIRLYDIGKDQPWYDLIFVEFASNKNWEDGMGGNAGDVSGIGYSFTVRNPGDYIITNLNRTGNMNIDIVIVIDRITNLGNQYFSTKGFDDAWNCFNFSWFIDYCNNGNKLINDPTFNVPDLRLEEELNVQTHPGVKNKIKAEYYMKSK